MKSVKDVGISGKRETVETVLEGVGVGHTSLKRGVNETTSTNLGRKALVTRHPAPVTRLAFTLIELLVVIAIMAVLAALIIPITGAVTRHKLRSRTRAELRSIETAIVDYKTKKGFYPPDNPNSAIFLNQLYYELSGTVLSNGVFTTLDGDASVNAAQQLPGDFGLRSQISGFMNTMKGAGDEGMSAQKYIRDLKPAQVATLASGIKLLVGSVGWEPNWPWQPIPPGPAPLGALKAGVNPFRYVSTNPTNNPGKFDLWIDILVQGKTNRVCNWSDDVIVL
jgi:prepilin-type N-terminal cleavage/methylation domain-containing protein